jgi:DNA repair protein RecO (recombination protein O)
MLAGFYLSELTLRLAPRQDPLPEVYLAYGEARARLAVGAGLAWTLRRFERELLAALGLGFDLESASDGQPIDPAARYALDPQEGPQRLLSERGGERSAAATGSALLALAADEEPGPADLASLRLPMRRVLAHHLGPRGLKSWELLEQLAPRR